MRVITGPQNIPHPPADCAVAIGNFDGIHRGHQKIIRVLLTTAEKEGLYPLLLTFHPHPAEILTDRKIELLQTLEQRLDEIKRSGVQMVVVISFDHAFAQVSPEEFIQTIIQQKLKAKMVVVGENFRFGKEREGDVNKLSGLAEKYGFSVQSVPPLIIDDSVVSSSLIRNLLHQGKIESANRLIGRPYEIEGPVIRGKSRGKKLGFPTANIHPLNDITPPGVFVSKITVGSQILPSVTHVGSKPTFGEKEIMVESYIIDYDDSLYDKKLRLQFLKKLREEKKFDTPEALSLQIKNDLKNALSYFRKQAP
jgi:riboflavin kinase/FMN adenylyltransferase